MRKHVSKGGRREGLGSLLKVGEREQGEPERPKRGETHRESESSAPFFHEAANRLPRARGALSPPRGRAELSSGEVGAGEDLERLCSVYLFCFGERACLFVARAGDQMHLLINSELNY